MQHVNGIIARNLKERREARKLSLDQLARASGVSRSMLAQIERGEATQEYITVFAGELTVQVGEKTYRVSTGDAIRFSADQAHGYRNDGTEMVRLSMVLQYAGVMA